MPLCLNPKIERITKAATGRAQSLFGSDCESLHAKLAAEVAGKRILVAGGAGSIGSATIAELLKYGPSQVCVLDTNENNLTELVRMVRSNEETCAIPLQVQPLDYGSCLARRFLSLQQPFDLVLSFAALKHVRSERDEFSLGRMLEVNLVKADYFLATLRAQGHGKSGVFFVSTDKAAQPVSLMGASKRVMELLLWAHGQQGSPLSLLDGGTAPALPRVTSARFANVAFSDGSLPWGFLQRIEKRQPLAAPDDVRRFLISPVEAGQLCLLGSVACPHLQLLIPKLEPEDTVRFTHVAEATLKEFGYSPVWFHSNPQAAYDAFASEVASGRYPISVTKTDTAGEKELEEFVAPGEVVCEIGLSGARSVKAPRVDAEELSKYLMLVREALDSGSIPSKSDSVRSLSALIPDFHYRDSSLSLDSRM